MVDEFLAHLRKDLELGELQTAGDSPGEHVLPLDAELKITIKEIGEGMMIKCLIAPYPKIREEQFSTEALLANLFGQTTHDAILGLTQDEETLTLTRIIDYPIEYKDFKDILEDFINVVDFWRDQALSHKQ